MEGKRNALSELEDDLRVMGLDVDGKESEILDKAQRIVGELAKVAYAEGLSYNAVNAVARSRAIAEEG